MAFTPVPPTPASGPSPSYIWWTTDTKLLWVYDTGWEQFSTLGAALTLTGVISPTAVAADQNNYSPTGLATCSIMRLTASSTYNITGLLAPSTGGQVLLIANIGSNTITFKNESASSTAANRFDLTADLALAASATCVLFYDVTSARWRAAGGAGGGGSGTVTSAGLALPSIFTVSGSPVTTTGTLTAVLAAPLVQPQGRLTLTSNTPVMIADVTAATSIYYAPYVGGRCPVYDGTEWTLLDISSQLTMALDSTNEPVSVIQDLFVYAGAAIGAGPSWINTATITVTIATPAVVTWTGHGLAEGAPVIFTTSSALPTGITAGTIYYVGKSPATNSFNISTSVANAAAGTFVATSGSQSGTQTGTNHTSIRGTGAGTTELQLLNGVWTNKNSITLTNGAGAGTSVAANRATYVGSFYTTAAGQTGMAFKPAAASGGTNNILGLWNAYNPVPVVAVSRDTTGGTDYTYNSTTWRAANASTSNRISWVDGLQQSAVVADNMVVGYMIAGAGSAGTIGTSLDSTSAAPGVTVQAGDATTLAGNMVSTLIANEAFTPQLGLHFAQRMEAAPTGTYNFAGTASSPARQNNSFALSLQM